MENIDIKQLSASLEFRDLTVEQAIRLIGEKEKALIIQEREKTMKEFNSKLDEKYYEIKNSVRP